MSYFFYDSDDYININCDYEDSGYDINSGTYYEGSDDEVNTNPDYDGSETDADTSSYYEDSDDDTNARSYHEDSDSYIKNNSYYEDSDTDINDNLFHEYYEGVAMDRSDFRDSENATNSSSEFEDYCQINEKVFFKNGKRKASSKAASRNFYESKSNETFGLNSSIVEDELQNSKSRNTAKIHCSSHASKHTTSNNLAYIKSYSEDKIDKEKPRPKKRHKSSTLPSDDINQAEYSQIFEVFNDMKKLVTESHNTGRLSLGDLSQAKYSIYTKILNEEVENLIKLLSPTKEDHCLRQWTINKITKTLQKKIPGCTVEVFGSFNSKLYLPASDLDMVVLIPKKFPSYFDSTSLLEKISCYLEDADLAEDTQIIPKAKIPIVKFKVPELGYNVDISLNSYSGQKSSQITIDYLKQYPGTRQLSLLVKYYLKQKSMNEVYTGGLGSYAVLLMVVSFIQNHHKFKSDKFDPLNNLGILFYEFLDFYGNKFNSTKYAISVSNGGSYSDPIPSGLYYEIPPITIWDPTDSKNNVTSGSFKYDRIKSTFRYAYQVLSHSIRLAEEDNRNLGEITSPKYPISILKKVLKVSEHDALQRKMIGDIFHRKKLNMEDYLNNEDLIELN